MSETKKTYMKINYEIRLELIRLVHEEGYSVKKAARKINIKESTARAIVIKYRSTNLIFEKKKDQERRALLAEFQKSYVGVSPSNQEDQENERNVENFQTI